MIPFVLAQVAANATNESAPVNASVAEHLPGVGITGFLILCVAVAAFVVAFTAGQRSSGRPAPEVEDAIRQAQHLEATAQEIRTLRSAALAAGAPPEVLREIDESQAAVDEAAEGVKRAAEQVV